LSQPTTFAEALEEAQSILRNSSDSPRLETQLILAHSTGRSRTWILAHQEEHLSGNQEDQFHALVQERGRGVPLPYLLGWWEFYGRRFKVNPQVLIPRPETELLVDLALKFLRENPEKRRVVDTGTGSGCIAITLAAELSHLEIFATDISFGALQVAAWNARDHGVFSQIHFIQMDLTNALSGYCDLVCANLPYIPSKEFETLEVGKWEPTMALDGGVEGLRYIQQLMDYLPGLVAEDGYILIEVHSEHANDVVEFARERLSRADIQVQQDLAGRDRLVAISMKGAR
jgi:release factor glutamine methyltransferase